MQITKKNVEGSVYCGQFLQFRKCEERIGKGGNGEVYLIKVLKGQDLIMKNWPDFHNREFVVKLFSVESKNHRIQRKRYKRFCQEVKKQLELSQLIEGEQLQMMVILTSMWVRGIRLQKTETCIS